MKEDSIYIARAKKLLQAAKGNSYSIEERRKLAIELAADMLQEAIRTGKNSERRSGKILARMMKDPSGKAFVTSVADQCFRSKNHHRTADQLKFLIDEFGIPKFLSNFQKLQILLFKVFGKLFSFFLVPLFLKTVRKYASSVIIPGSPSLLIKHLKKRRKDGISVNLNHIGEAILGESEARIRLEEYLNDLKNPMIECISVKVSTLYSQISLPSFEETLKVLKNRFAELYQAATLNDYILQNGKKIQKFVYLDMEEYRDLSLTVELFCKTLEDPRFACYSAGIVLQAYLPESFLLQQKITSWAKERVKKGGAPIRIRIVKGANMAMELVDASLHGWKEATFLKKMETDANYKRMLLYGCLPENTQAVSLGVASHNLFDIAFAMLLRVEKCVEEYVDL